MKIFIALIFCTFLYSTAYAADYWICDSTTAALGDDDGSTQANCADGATSANWQTGIDGAEGGNTLRIKAGEEYPTSSTTFALSGTGALMLIGSDNGTITLYGAGADPLIKGDRDPAVASSGDHGIRISENVDNWTISNIDFQGWKFGVFTGSNNTGKGHNDNINFINVDISITQFGWRIYGNPDGTPSPDDGTDVVCSVGCSIAPTVSSTGMTFTNCSSINFSSAGWQFRNGNQNVTITNPIGNGGGDTYDVEGQWNGSSCEGGQIGIDIGRTSGGTVGSTNNFTPDENFTITNPQMTQMSNEACGAHQRQGDGIKMEALTTGTITGGFTTLASDSGIDSKGDWVISNWVGPKNRNGVKSYSGNKTSGKGNDYVTVLNNVHVHNNAAGPVETTAATYCFQTYGEMTINNSTCYDSQDNGDDLFSLKTTFCEGGCNTDTLNMVLTNTVYGVSATGASNIGRVEGKTANFTDNNNYDYCHDGNTGTMCNGGIVC